MYLYINCALRLCVAKELLPW